MLRLSFTDAPQSESQSSSAPLLQPVKKASPSKHLKPIILLFTLRKILAISMIRRSVHKLLKKISRMQSAYQQGRSATEMMFSFKVLTEKAITLDDWEITLLLLDISKAFDALKKKDLFNILKEALDEEELHVIKLLVGVKFELQVPVGIEIGNKIRTNMGVPQWDCFSTILFITYLGEALSQVQATQM